MRTFEANLANINTSVNDALKKLDDLGSDAILFIIDDNIRLLGSLTDGDLRRGFIKGLTLHDELSKFMQTRTKYIEKGNYDLNELLKLRENLYQVIPIVNGDKQIINIINFRYKKSYLPIDAVIMAGGRGERLRPLTDILPKPLLKVGSKPIIEHNIDRLSAYGIEDIWISLKYLGEKIQEYFKDGSPKSLKIDYVWEEKPLGTAGAISLINNFKHDHVLLMNSDLLTNIDFEEFFIYFQSQNADFAVACIPYEVSIPYAVMEIDGKTITGFKEKPSHTHYINAGIYLMKREITNLIPDNSFYNATDLMEDLIRDGKKVISYPLIGYWLDIGKHEDYKRAQIDIESLKLIPLE